MKLSALLIVTSLLLLNGCSPNKIQHEAASNTEHVALEEALTWDEVERFINSIVENQLTLSEGKDSIISFLHRHYPGFETKPLAETDFNKLQQNFLTWVRLPLQHEPPDQSIKSLYFGMFESPDKRFASSDETSLVFYLAGSQRAPEEDPDNWAVNPAYIPADRYIVFDQFKLLFNHTLKYKENSDIQQIVMNGISNLIIYNSIPQLKKLTGRDTLSVGAGFDEGPAFTINP